MPRLDEPLHFEDADRIADGAAADAEDLGEFTFGGKLVAGLEATLGEQTLDLRRDLRVDFGLPDGAEIGLDG
ncbi:MAG TPA: hypothetical protein VGX75_17560 [bacterium]|nr:hypothetical protein [bacterium]